LFDESGYNSDKSLEDAFFAYEVKLNQLSFDRQMQYGIFYSYVKLKEQEIRYRIHPLTTNITNLDHCPPTQEYCVDRRVHLTAAQDEDQQLHPHFQGLLRETAWQDERERERRPFSHHERKQVFRETRSHNVLVHKMSVRVFLLCLK